MLKSYFKVAVIVIILFSIFVSIMSLSLFKYGCDNDCVLMKEEMVMPDFSWNYNTVKAVAATGIFPKEVEYVQMGKSWLWPMWHSPLYYYLSANIYHLALLTGSDPILLLHLFSILIISATNIAFYSFLKVLASKLGLGREFILYGLMLFVFLPTHLFVSLIVVGDPLFYFFMVLSLYMFLVFLGRFSLISALSLGSVLGLALLSSLGAVMLFIASSMILAIFLLKREWKHVILLMISLLTGSLIGIYPIIRNLLTFGTLYRLGDDLYPTKLRLLWRPFTAFWGGIFGGYDSIYYLVVLAVVLLTLLTLSGLLLSFRNKWLYFLLAIVIVNIVLGVQWNCNFLYLIQNSTCMVGVASMNRYFIGLEPAIAVYSSIAIMYLGNKSLLIRRLSPYFVIASALLFAIDFIAAFV